MIEGQFRMILKSILKKERVKPQAASSKPVDNLKKDLTCVGFSYICLLYTSPSPRDS